MAVFPATSREGDNGDLSQAALERALGAGVPAVRFFAQCDSTNRVAMRWAEQGIPEGCLVVADHQRAGRGRLGRAWFGAPGRSLLFSLVLRPDLAPDRLGLIGLAAGAGLSATLAREGFQARLKWPNDVLVAGRKAAGILSETRCGREGTARPPVILGVGVNVNVEREAFPPELRASATSLAAEAGRSFDRVALLAGFLARFRRLYSTLATTPPPVLDAYRRRCDTLGARVRIEGVGRVFEATAVDIDPSGGLVLDTGEVLTAGDVIHVR